MRAVNGKPSGFVQCGVSYRDRIGRGFVSDRNVLKYERIQIDLSFSARKKLRCSVFVERRLFRRRHEELVAHGSAAHNSKFKMH